MVKETVTSTTRESGIKKRRKNPATADGDAELDVYKKVVNFEEKGAFKRSAEVDAKLYCEICKNIRALLAEIFELKSQKTVDAAAKISDKTMQAAACVVTLKKLNRLEKVRSTTAREALNVEKQKVDSTNLQYQNLMYEAAHLFSEFKKCKQFKSKDEDIELVSVEEFFKEAPEEKTKQFKNIEMDLLDDIQKHELHLARLEWELTQRKKLAELCHTFEDEKKQVGAEIVKSKNRLGGLGPKLAVVLESTKPLQDYLGLPIEKTFAEHKLASLLPNSLYLFYANTDAYKKVYDIDLSLEIIGDQDEALQWKQLQSAQAMLVDESDAENEQQEESTEVKKRRHRKASHIDRAEEKKKRLLEPHPLSVQVTIRIKDGPTLKVHLTYRKVLNIVTVTSDVECPSTITGNAAKEVISGESVLGELFDADFGTDSPNPSNPYQLKKIGVSGYSNLVPKLGYAYSWAQRVCGLDFLTAKNDKGASMLSCTNVEIVMKVLNKRLKSRTALALQLQQLEQNILPNIPDTVNLPRKTVSSLTKWTTTTWQEFCKNPSTADFIANEIVGPGDLFYSATIFRPKTATLNALIAIKNDYPNQPPIFSLTVKYNGELHSGNCDEVRDIERAVNVGWNQGTTSGSWLLAAQLFYLCAYFDVYLETVAPSSFVPNSVFFKNVCARNRRHPFKFRKVGAGIFTQF